MSAGADEDVVRADVAVEESRCVDLSERIHHGRHEPKSRLIGNAPALAFDILEQRLAVEILHHHIAGIVGGKIGDHRDDVGTVMEAGHDAGLVEEPVQSPSVVFVVLIHGHLGCARRSSRDSLRQVLFHRDLPFQAQVPRQVQDAEAPVPEHAADHVLIGQHRSRRKVECRLRLFSLHPSAVLALQRRAALPHTTDADVISGHSNLLCCRSPVAKTAIAV